MAIKSQLEEKMAMRSQKDKIAMKNKEDKNDNYYWKAKMAMR